MRHAAKVVSGDFAPNGQRIFTRTNDSEIYLWDKKGELIKSLKQTAYIYDAAFLDQGNYLITANAAGNINKYDSQGELIQIYDYPTYRIA